MEKTCHEGNPDSPKKEPLEGALFLIYQSPTLAIPTIQASLAAIHDHQRLGAALVAHAGAGRETAVVGAFGAAEDDQLLPFALRKGGSKRRALRRGRRCNYFTVFF